MLKYVSYKKLLQTRHQIIIDKIKKSKNEFLHEMSYKERIIVCCKCIEKRVYSMLFFTSLVYANNLKYKMIKII